MDSTHLTIDEAANRMAVPTAWVKALIENGQLKAEQHGEYLVIDACEITSRKWDVPPEPVAAPLGSVIRISATVGAIVLH